MNDLKDPEKLAELANLAQQDGQQEQKSGYTALDAVADVASVAADIASGGARIVEGAAEVAGSVASGIADIVGGILSS